MKKSVLFLFLFSLLYPVFSQCSDPYRFVATAQNEAILLEWDPSSVAAGDFFEISTVVKKIGQGRKPFTNPVVLDSQVRTHRLNFEGLSDVFVRFRVYTQSKVLQFEKIQRVEVLKADVQTLTLEGRKIYVYLPPGYSESGAPYDVVLLQDGQNLFSSGSSTGPTEWRVDETLTGLIAQQKVRPLVVVGISSSTDRVTSFWPRSFGYSEGKGEEYAAWITEKLVPALRERFHLAPSRWTAGGSSYGAVISLYLGFQYRGLFSKIAALSPAMDLGGQEFVRSQAPGMEKIYFDAGEKEQYRIIHPQVFDFPQNALDLVRSLVDQGYVYGKTLAYYEDPHQVSHKEDVVAARMDNMFLFLFNDQRKETSRVNESSTTFPDGWNRVIHYSDGLRISDIAPVGPQG